MAAGALEVCVVLLLSVSLSLFLRLPYLWSPALDLSRGRVCVCTTNKQKKTGERRNNEINLCSRALVSSFCLVISVGKKKREAERENII